MSDRNNARTIEGIREKIREIADSKTLLDAQEKHAYRLGWIGALYWCDVLDAEVFQTLRRETTSALIAWERAARDKLDTRTPTDDEQAGIDWWNNLDEAARRHWMLQAGDTGVAADAWAALGFGEQWNQKPT